MAIVPMQKVMIVAHCSQSVELLETLQKAGIAEILGTEHALICLEWPELTVEFRGHREFEDILARIEEAIAFLRPHAGKEQTSVFAPMIEVDSNMYLRVISAEDTQKLLDEIDVVSRQMEKLTIEADYNMTFLEKLLPWKSLSIPVEDLYGLGTSTTFAGLIAEQHFDAACEKLSELGAAVEKVATHHRVEACIVVCLNESAANVQKALRSVEFETVSFEDVSGLVNDRTVRIRQRLQEIKNEQAELAAKAGRLAEDKLKLQILFDHLQNLHHRASTHSGAPASDNVVFFESWVKKKDYPALEKLVAGFDACNVAPIEPGPDEEPPMEIENPPYVRPFEAITRLYGMPSPSSVDPTVFLAPFFAIFFGLCLNDAAYGIIMVALLAWVLKKIRGNKRMYWMMAVCGVMTIVAGAITGSWFGDAVTALLPAGSGVQKVLNGAREKIMLFDPMTKPMTFFVLSLGLGYLQIQVGLFVAFFANLLKKDIAAAIFDQLTWIGMLNCFLLLGLSKGGILSAGFARPAGYAAMGFATLILFFSGRGMGLTGRLGMGVFQLFSTVFYMGDVLSYVRLMALGMVGTGFGMATNVLTKLAADIPYVGWLLGALVFVAFHALNLALSALGAFVHSMRLQFVEFFPKFFTGGGRNFKPFQNTYRYIDIKK
ncbi:MAG: V-type ATP synthase subunit I [Phycisphaerae bacterium]|nr:V-type ATP synthase subunit I [Phycisphaerae bacterium]